MEPSLRTLRSMYDINTITPVVTELVTLVEAKAHLKIDHTDEDSLLTDLIKASRSALEKYCGVSIGTQEREWIADMDCIEEIPYGPVIGVTKVEYKTAMDTYDDYTEEGRHEVDGRQFKTFEPFITGRWIVTYDCGYTADNVPPELKLAILHELAYRYENRGDSTGGVCVSAKKLAHPYRRILT